MKIEFVNHYGVISDLTSTELPDFAVLIGPNGAGKSHLFQALLTGDLAISGITKEEVQRYDVFSFRPPPSGEANRQTSELARGLIDAFFVRRSGKPSFNEMSLEIFDEAVATLLPFDADVDARVPFVAGWRDEIHRIPRQGVFGFDRDNAYTAALLDKVLMPIFSLDPYRNSRNSDPRESQYLRLLRNYLKT